MKGRQKALFSFLFFLAFSQLNLSWKFEPLFPSHFRKFLAFFAIIFYNWGKMVIRLVFLSISTIWIVKYCTKTRHFQILVSFIFSLCYYLLQSTFSPASCSTAVFKKPFTWERRDLWRVSERRIKLKETFI